MKNSKKKYVKKFFLLIGICVVSVFVYNIYLMYMNIEIKNSYYESKKVVSSSNYEQNESNNSIYNQTQEDMLEDVIDSVVGISLLKNTGGSILTNVSNDKLGLGTGIIVSENGYILSNSHVTGEIYSICYETNGNNSYKGLVVFYEPDLDLSIVKVNAKGLKPVKLGDSSQLKIGRQVYAIGNPIGYEFKRTVTSGIISAVNRTIKIEDDEDVSYISDLIQTDATINPGNSGGPLVNKYGEVIGINTVKITSAEGIGFAIPINVIKPVIEGFINLGKFEVPTLGVYAYDSEIAEYMKLKNKNISGIYISQILPNGPAANQDLKEGDLIISIDSNRLRTMNDLREYIYGKKPGDKVTLKIIRNNKEHEINIMLGKK